MSISSGEFDYIRTLVHQQSAIVLEKGKEYLVETRLVPLARDEGFPSLEEMVRRLRITPPNLLHRKVVEAMTTNETSFFRDFYPFEVLRRSVLPQLIATRAAERQLVIWSAACSTGQEVYSIAMLLRESFPQLQDWNIRLVASDLSTETLERARVGRFSQLEVNRGLPASLLVKYFRKQGVEWEISEDIRRMVDFHEINLIAAWPILPLMDIVFMRNVLIYFDIGTKKMILTRLRRLLPRDGYLFLGGAETTFNLDDAFERAVFDRAGCYRLRGQ